MADPARRSLSSVEGAIAGNGRRADERFDGRRVESGSTVPRRCRSPSGSALPLQWAPIWWAPGKVGKGFMGDGPGQVSAAPGGVDVVATPAAVPSAPCTWPKWLSGRAASAVAMACFAMVVVATFALIHRYAMNITYRDQWSDVALIRRAHDGTLTIGALWAQHNENRILFPNLVVLLLSYTTRYNVVVEDYLSGIALCGSAALVVLTHRRRSPGMPWLAYVPVAAVLLSAAVTTDALYGFNFSWCLALLAFGATLYCVDRPALSWLWLAAAVAAAVVGSYSTLQGMLIWPSVLVLLWLRRRSSAIIAAWIAGTLATTAIYFFHFGFATAGVATTPSSSVSAMTMFGIQEIGNVIGSQQSARADFVIGACVLVVVIVALVVGGRRDGVGGAPVGMALLTFGLLFVVVATVGRADLGLGAALRYAPFVLDVWVGAYLVLLSSFRDPASTAAPQGAGDGASADGVPVTGVTRRSRLRRGAAVAFVGLSAALVFQSVSTWSQRTLDARGWNVSEQNVANVEANIGSAPDLLVRDQLGPFPANWVRSLVQFERTRRLNLFGTGLAAAEIRQGLDPTLVTAVLRPYGWTTVSGNALLDASAYVDHPVRVEFVATAPGLPSQVVSGSVQTTYGWIGQWNTRDVPDGVYRLFSRVRDRSGRTYQSAVVVAEVSNHR